MKTYQTKNNDDSFLQSVEYTHFCPVKLAIARSKLWFTAVT